jgi:hypothetical protein
VAQATYSNLHAKQVPNVASRGMVGRYGAMMQRGSLGLPAGQFGLADNRFNELGGQRGNIEQVKRIVSPLIMLLSP